MFPIIMPNPIGTRRRGSQPLIIAIAIKPIPIAIMIRFCHVTLAKPVKCQNCWRLSMTVSIQNQAYAIFTISWSTFTESPLLTSTAVTVPSAGASISFSIFMASRTATF